MFHYIRFCALAAFVLHDTHIGPDSADKISPEISALGKGITILEHCGVIIGISRLGRTTAKCINSWHFRLQNLVAFRDSIAIGLRNTGFDDIANFKH